MTRVDAISSFPPEQLETMPAGEPRELSDTADADADADADPDPDPDHRDSGTQASSASSALGIDSYEVLRAIAYAPSRRPADVMAPGSPWGEADRYTIQRRLGRGGMGSVYAAVDGVLDRIVALKVLDATGDDDRDRVLREAKLAARVEHERIARVYAPVGTRGSASWPWSTSRAPRSAHG
jgi:serine/threonine protein kinase